MKSLKLCTLIYATLLAMTFAGPAFAQDTTAQTPVTQNIEQVVNDPAPPKVVETTNVNAEPVTVVQAPAKEVVVKSETPADTSWQDWINSVLTLLGGKEGATTAAIILALIQGILLAVNKYAANWNLTGNTKFYIVGGLTLLVGPVTLWSQGMDVKAALLSSVFLAALVDYIFQVVTRAKSTVKS